MSISRETLRATKEAMERLEEIRAALGLANNREALEFIAIQYPIPVAGQDRLNRAFTHVAFDKEQALCDVVQTLRTAERATLDDIYQIIGTIGEEHGKAPTARPGAAS